MLFKVLVFVVSLCFIKEAYASEVYSAEYNTYYQRSQHTYAWHDLEDTHWSMFAPAIYIMYKDYEDASKNEEWNFTDKYKYPWSTSEDKYFLAFCADLIYDFWPVKKYEMMAIGSSTFLKEEIKKNLSGIVKHSYPFVPIEDMIAELLDAHILVETKNKDGKTIYTAVKNAEEVENLEYTIDKDELLSATQMAIYYFTDRDKVDKVYDKTALLSTNFHVIDRTRVYEEAGEYDAVRNNIEAVYNYLITLKEDYTEPLAIKSAVKNDNNDLVVTLNYVPDNTNKLEIVLKDQDTVILQKKVAELKQDELGRIIVPIGELDYTKYQLVLQGTILLEDEVVAFEAENGPDKSQTLIGKANVETPVSAVYQKGIRAIRGSDILVKKIADKQIVGYNESFTYTIIVKNLSGTQLDDIVFHDELHPYFELVETDGVVNGRDISWNISLAPNEEKSLKVLVKVKEDVEQLEVKNVIRVNLYDMLQEQSVTVSIFENPKTGTTINFVGVSLGLGIMGLILYSYKKNKLYRLK